MNDLRRAKGAPRSGRGHQNADRSITALKNKIYYWTESRLEKLLSCIIIRRRQAWFAARVKALKSWPEFDKETLDYSWIQPRRGMDGKWYWPKSQLTIEREALETAPHDSIDLVALRETLAGLDNRQGDRLIDMLAERVDLEAVPTLLESPSEHGMPAPKEIGTPFLRRLKRLHNRLLEAIARDPDGDIVASRQLEVPRANPQSHSGSVAGDEIWSPPSARGKRDE